jgi:hypothetical protein
MSLTASLRLLVQATQYSTLDLGAARFPVTYDKTNTLANGTAAGQADLLWTDTRTLAASASESLDLAGSLVGAFGATLTFARIKGLIIRAADGNTNDVLAGGAAANGWATAFGDPTDKVKIKPGGTLALLAPGATAYPVTPATGDLLQVANSGAGTSVTYDIIVIGASA